MATSTSVVEYENKPPRKPNVTDIIPPVDFSFLKLTTLDECNKGETRELSLHKYQPVKTKIIQEDGEEKFISHCLRMNNNKMQEVNGLMAFAITIFDSVSNIEWIDLSFNLLNHIDPVLTQFENLKILYLHGNCITELKEVNKLASLKKLWKLTLHGNDIENIKGYRQYVLSTIPNLVSFDFSGVTKGDVMTAKTWKSFTNPEKHKKISRD